MPNSASAIEIEGLTIRRFGEGGAGRAIVSDFALLLGERRKAVLYGPSGCGKTTVLKAVMGFVAPEAGEIAIRGTQLDASSVWRLRREMTYVPQEPDPGEGTVEEVIRRPFGYRSAAGLTWNEAERAALFTRFHLAEAVLGQEVCTLSAGERQRVALISALLLRRSLLLLDEPTSALDAASRAAVHEYLALRTDLTVLSASHDPGFLPYADHVVRMEKRVAENVV